MEEFLGEEFCRIKKGLGECGLDESSANLLTAAYFNMLYCAYINGSFDDTRQMERNIDILVDSI